MAAIPTIVAGIPTVSNTDTGIRNSALVAPRLAGFVIGQQADQWFNALIYGEPGVGKTVLAASSVNVPWMRDVLFIDADQGTASITETGIFNITPTTYKNVSDAVEFLALHCRMRDAGDDEGLARLSRSVFSGIELPHRFRTVVIDTLTETQKLVFYQIMGVTIGRERLDAEMNAATYKEWQQNSEMVRKLVRTLRNLPINVILICHEKIDEDETKRRYRSPNLPGKLSAEVQAFVDVVGNLRVSQTDEGGTARRLYVQPGRTWNAKNRLERGGSPYIDEPTMMALVAPLTNKRQTTNKGS